MPIFISVVMFLGGAYALYGAGADKSWFMENPKVRPFTQLLGRSGARTFYMVLGTILILLGWLIIRNPEFLQPR